MTAPFTWGTSQWGDATQIWATRYDYSAGITATSSATGPDQILIQTSGQSGAVSFSEAGTGFSRYVDASGTGIFVSKTTARLYARLPDCYRDADAAASANGTSGTLTSFPLLRWLACLVDQAGDIEALIDRFTPPAASALTDPSQADSGWLPWLGQLVGVTIPAPVPNVPEARAAIANAVTGTPRGSRGSIVAAVQPLLTGTKSVTVTDHYSGNPWQVRVATLAAETPASIVGQQGFKWGSSQWGTGTAVWGDPDPIVWWLELQGLAAAGFTFVHTTS